MLLIICLTVCGVALPGRQRRELPGFPGLNFEAAALPLTLSQPLVASASSLFIMNRSCGRLIPCVIFGLCTIFAFARIANGAPEEAAGSIQEMMSPEEFRAAGLNKLTPDELVKLDAWLQGYRQVTEQKAEKVASARAAKIEKTKMDLLVSRVDGTFNGLTGRTIIRLEDGTVWKQANADDRYRPKVTDHPAAVVIHGIFGYKMQVEGTQEFYVDPVRNP
ncbi:MAG: hypothetical protein DME80_04045 [Verrucomicrobia bacterium]|nr:MAG: hypothetical protein DME80_04045 [Verrucomicrobiota bacterium]